MAKRWEDWEIELILEHADQCTKLNRKPDLNYLNKKIKRGTNAINMMVYRLEYARKGWWFESSRGNRSIVNRINALRIRLDRLGFLLTPTNVMIKYNQIKWIPGHPHGNVEAPKVNTKTDARCPKPSVNMPRVHSAEWRVALEEAKGSKRMLIYGEFCKRRSDRKQKLLAWGTYRREINGYLVGNEPYTNAENRQFVQDIVEIVRQLNRSVTGGR